MKNGVYFGEYWNELFVISDNKIEDNFGRPISDIPYNHQLVYIGEFWDESAELERYTCAIIAAKSIITEILVSTVNPLSLAIDKTEKYCNQIDCILNGEVAE